MRSIENTLALWVEGVLSSMNVVAWADREIQRQQTPYHHDAGRPRRVALCRFGNHPHAVVGRTF